MVELDKPVTMANYVFILLSTMMTSIAFNHVILKGLIIEDTSITIPNKTIHDLYLLKIDIETKVSELNSLINQYNAINEVNNQDRIDKLEIKVKIGAKYVEYQTELSAYKTEATNDYKKIFKFKFIDDIEYPLDRDYVCDTDPQEFFVDKVGILYKLFETNNPFTNTSFEGFSEGRYKLTDEGQLKDEEYTQNITNGSIAVYIFAVLISIAGLFYHTRGYHIIGALINMAIAAMGLHLWTLYHEKKDNLAEIDKSYMENIILASWVLCLLTFTVFIFVYLHNDDSSF